MNILYIHGYNGNMHGNSYLHLAQHSSWHNLHSIDYDPEQPEQAIQSIKQYVADNQIDLIIGASLGGFLAMHIFGVPRIVVNPCWNPAIELPIVGYTGDTAVYERLLSHLLKNINEEESRLCTGCFAANDELLGTRYKSEFEKYFQHTFDISDGHKITATSAQEILDYVSKRDITDKLGFGLITQRKQIRSWINQHHRYLAMADDVLLGRTKEPVVQSVFAASSEEN